MKVLIFFCIFLIMKTWKPNKTLSLLFSDGYTVSENTYLTETIHLADMSLFSYSNCLINSSFIYQYSLSSFGVTFHCATREWPQQPRSLLSMIRCKNLRFIFIVTKTNHEKLSIIYKFKCVEELI